MTGECPTCGRRTCRHWDARKRAVPALVRLAQHCEEGFLDLSFLNGDDGLWLCVVGHATPSAGTTIEAAAEAALTRLAEEAPNA